MNASATKSLDSGAGIHAEGFDIVECVFEDAEMVALSRTFTSAGLPRSRAGVRHAMKIPAVATLARDHRLRRIAAAAIGADALPFRATLFDKSPAANWLVAWHQDTALPLRARHDVPGWGPWSLKSGIRYAHAPASALRHVVALRLHLDDSTADNGPLRVLPRTHALGVLTDGDMQRLARERTPIACVAKRGGVLVMRPLLVHASSKSHTDAPRRVLHIEYAASMRQEHDLELAIA